MNILDFKLYIFDLDGVIIDSEKLHWEAYKKAIGNEYEYFNKNILTYEKYCEINHGIDENISFKNILKSNYDKVYKKKKEYYYSNLNKLCLINGYENFFNKLILNNKIVCLVTDSSKETLDMIINKFPFLNKMHYMLTRNDIKNRKPSSDGYLKILDKYNNIRYSDIIGFEDSYKGYISMSQVIYSTILVNKKNYFYYDIIKSTINTDIIDNYKNFDNYLINNYNNVKKFYISSKTKHDITWFQLKKNFHLTSTWIDVKTSKENLNIISKQEICSKILNDIEECDYIIFYIDENEKKNHYGSIMEIGMGISLNKKIYICGNNIYDDEVLFNFKDIFDKTYLNVHNVKNILYNLNLIETEKYKLYLNKLNLLYNKMKVNCKSINNNNIDYIVISAAGKGTRLLPITKHIPKLLATYNDNCLLNNIVNYWKKYCNKFIIIINNDYNSLVKFYLDLLNIEYEIINVDIINNYENSYTLHNALSKKKFLNKKLLITWCDIYPNIEIDYNIFKEKNIIFTYKNFGRYEAYDNTIIKKEYGNIIGIYYFANFTYLDNFAPEMDLCDCYKTNFGDFETYEIEDLIDIGDMQKLIKFTNKQKYYITRYFNKITDLNDGTLKKESTCEYGNKIIDKELYFYKYHMHYNFMPTIYEYGTNYFIMEKIQNSKQVIKYFNESIQSKQIEIIKKCLNIIENLHSQEKIKIKSELILCDLNIEFRTKIVNRLSLISPILKYFSFIKKVNYNPICITHNEIINKLSQKVTSFFKNNITEYYTIHGDCHLSNILIDSSENYYLIDPRGYFGETNIFGVNYYDIGKILYSLSGFDELNNRNNHFFIIENDNIIVNINNNMDNYLFLFEKYNIPILIDMVILHWLGLAEYSKNNIHKCVSAYYYSIYLYQKYYLK